MSVMTGQLAGSLQTLIDARLDTIDRMLMGRVPRQDRLAIVREVESQVFELLQDCQGAEPSRDDVLAVLARLDPPEAYLPDESSGEPVPPRAVLAPRVARTPLRGVSGVARASAVLGLLALLLAVLGLPLTYLIAVTFESEAALFILGGGALAWSSVGSILGIVLGIYARGSGVWAVIGVVTSLLALLALGALGVFVLLHAL